LVCAAAAQTGLSQDAAPAWELRPYRIQVLVAVDREDAALAALDRELPAYLEARALAVEGGAWQLRAAPASPTLRQSMLESLEQVLETSLPADSLEADKVLLLVVARSGDGYVARARELDVVANLWNAIVAVPGRQQVLIKQAAFAALRAAFSAQARIDQVEENSVTLRLRAAALARPDGTIAQLAAGSVFCPVLVDVDRRGKPIPGKAVAAPWTYLHATQRTGSVLNCRLETALAEAPIPSYHPLRQRWALAVARGSGPTRLKLVSSVSPDLPLEGYDVQAIDGLPSGGAADGPAREIVGHTDRQGEVSISPSPTAVVRTIVIKRGNLELARAPLAPGLVPQITLEVPESRRRLEIEAALAEVEDALADLAARRAVLAARLKQLVEPNNQAATTLRQQLAALTVPEAMLRQLSEQEQAISSLDPSARQVLAGRAGALRKLAEQLKPPPSEP
jgi:hypothetical protein